MTNEPNKQPECGTTTKTSKPNMRLSKHNHFVKSNNLKLRPKLPESNFRIPPENKPCIEAEINRKIS
jgi:hypothetical protein